MSLTLHTYFLRLGGSGDFLIRFYKGANENVLGLWSNITDKEISSMVIWN